MKWRKEKSLNVRRFALNFQYVRFCLMPARFSSVIVLTDASYSHCNCKLFVTVQNRTGTTIKKKECKEKHEQRSNEHDISGIIQD